MSETVTDRVFGKLVWDGFHHEGWAGSFADDEFLSWGSAVRAALPEDDEEDEEADSATTDTTGFLSDMLSAVRADLESDEEARKLINLAESWTKRVDAYDGSLDADRLRKSGRLKVVVRNPRDTPPTKAQRAAWQAFRKRGKKAAEQVAAALLDVYRRQRPERVRWWKAAYGDSPNKTLPAAKTTKAMRDLVQVSEFRVYPEQNGTPTVAVILEAFWCDKDIKVSLRDGRVVDVNRVEHSPSSRTGDYEEIESPTFGRLRRRPNDDEWIGVFHSDHLRGWDDASKTRYRFKKDRGTYTSTPYRPGPSWDTVSGDFDLRVDAEKGQLPSPTQEAAFAAFNKNPKATAGVVLSAILDWYREIRPKWIKHMNGSRESIASVMPNLRTPEGLLEIIQLQSVTILREPPPEETQGPRQVTVPFGPKSGRKIKIPPKKPGVAIILHFHWEDEHGLAVRWRNGQVESVGDWESAYEH